MSGQSPQLTTCADGSVWGPNGRVAPKPASLPISVTPVGEHPPLLCIKVGPLFTYANIDEAVALRAQLDLKLARWSGGFL